MGTIFLFNLALSLIVGLFVWGPLLGNLLLGAADGCVVAGAAWWWVRRHNASVWSQFSQGLVWWINTAICSGLGAWIGNWFDHQTIGGLGGAAFMLIRVFGKRESAFEVAYRFFNSALFANALPAVTITLESDSAAVCGSFLVKDVWIINLNPAHFARSDEEILSTLVHEMVHVWQEAYGSPPHGNYHDGQWAAKMRAVGLLPTATGEPGGQQTGSRMTHLIIPGGAYAWAYSALQTSGFQLREAKRELDQLNPAL